MDPYRLILSPRAYADLADIHDYISRDSVDRASVMIGRILDSIEALTLAPHHNIAEKIKGPRPTRTLPVQSYIVYFEVLEADHAVRVLRIRHGAQRLPTDLE